MFGFVKVGDGHWITHDPKPELGINYASGACGATVQPDKVKRRGSGDVRCAQCRSRLAGARP